MCAQNRKMMILGSFMAVLFLLLIPPVTFAQVVFPDVNMEVENAVPYEIAMHTAQLKAEALWGEVAPGEAIPCCDDDGDLVAYMVPFIIGARVFPDYEDIQDRILMGREAYDELAKKLEEGRQDFPHDPVMAPGATSVGRDDAQFGPPSEGDDLQALGFVEGEEARRIDDGMTARTLAKKIKYGINEYGTIYVSARYDRFPIPLTAHYLSPFFSVGDLAMQKAQEALGTQDVRCSRYYFLGRNRGQFFEFSSAGRKVLLEAYMLELKSSDEVLVRAGNKVRPSAEMRTDMNLSWDQATLQNPGGSKTGSTLADHTVTNPHFVPDVDWCRGCTPTAAAMAIGYWDNYVNGATYTGYGRLIDSWCELTKYSNGTGPLRNIPNMVEELRIAMNTDVSGTTMVGDIEPGMEQVCNIVNGYSFNTMTYYASGGDWNWAQITSEIDNNRAFVWSVGYNGAIGHSVCAWGYTDAYYVITYSTWGRGRDDWYYTQYDNDIDLDWSYVHTVEPAGSTYPHSVVLDGPDGGETFFWNDTCTIRYYQFGTLIYDVDLYYSTDKGVTWQLIQGYVPSTPNSWNNYIWNVPNLSSHGMRVRVKAYDSASNYIAGDGSFENFTIIKNCDLFDDGESYRSFSPKKVWSGQSEAFEIHCDIRNGGNEDSGPFKVKFYASTNTTITSLDHFLGTVNMASVPGGTWSNCDLAGTYPTSIPTGTYWIGWIIDADNEVPETNEYNNVAYKEGYQLFMAAPPVPDIKVNNQDSNLSVPFGTSLSFSIHLDPGGMVGQICDYYVFVNYDGVQNISWIYPHTWKAVVTPVTSFQYSLIPINKYVFVSGVLPKGTFDFTFVVDKGDGVYEGTFSDSVMVKVY